jgi:hypothetical protein
MTDRDRVKLMFGPYKAPPLRRGDRAFCLLRDCDVVITSWTDARIPWPRCRALDGTGGGSGLLLDEELARAVRHEAAGAVMYWWGASSEAVKRWRRALGVGRTDNEGSRRLIRAAAAAGGEALRERGLTVVVVRERGGRDVRGDGPSVIDFGREPEEDQDKGGPPHLRCHPLTLP